MSPGVHTRRYALAMWSASLAVTLWVLHRLGGDLATPPPPWRWGPWLDRVDGPSAVVALLRVGAITATWYLVLLTVLGAVTRRSASDRAVRLADRVSPEFLRALLGSAGGLTISAAGLTIAVAPLLSPAGGGAPAPVAAAQSPSAALRQVRAPDPVRVEIDPRLTSTEPRATSEDQPVASLERFVFDLAPMTVSPDAAEEWLVQTGDHFWTIAADTLADNWGREPTEEEVAPYWTSLVAENADRLVVAGDADLIYPGQAFVLPAVPPAPPV